MACKDCWMKGDSVLHKTIYPGNVCELPQFHQVRGVYAKKMAKPYQHLAFRPPRTKRTHESIMAAGRESEDFKGDPDAANHPRRRNGFHKEPYFSKVRYLCFVFVSMYMYLLEEVYVSDICKDIYVSHRRCI